MKKNNLIIEKTYAFSLIIIQQYKTLIKQHREYVLSKQLLRSGASIGANMEEAQGAQSKRDFFAKLTIAYKEARESRYWIRLLYDSNYIDHNDYNLLIQRVEEILRIIGSIQRKIKQDHIN